MEKLTPPTSLKDPQPSVDRIEELARRILTGDIYLPKFQRDFVWTEEKVIDLLDSISRGYPIGSILLWQSKQQLRSENKIADLEIATPKFDYPVNYLLDGQQRLSTICGALYWKTGDTDSKWNLAYDLRAEQFIHLKDISDPPTHQIRVNKLSDPAEYFKHVYSLETLNTPDKDDLKSRAEKLFNRFKDYKIATVTLGDMQIKDVAPIFERINSKGTPLTIVDLMRAATWSEEFDLVDAIENLLSECSGKNFHSIDRKVVLRNFSAASCGGFTTDSINDLRKLDPDKLKDTVKEVLGAYRLAVDFLSTQIKIINSDILPYANQITVIAEVFRQLPKPTSLQYSEIEKWFWKTSLSSYFKGWSNSDMARDYKSIKEFSTGKSQSIIFEYKESTQKIWEISQFRSTTALSKLFAIILSNEHPLDLLTQQKIDLSIALSWKNQPEFHHLFPLNFLKKCGIPREASNVLANIIVLTSDSNKKISEKAPSLYLKEVIKESGSNLDQILKSNLISKSALAAALQDNYPEFIRIRAGDIHNWTQSKI